MNLIIASFCAGLAVGCVVAYISVSIVAYGYEKSIPAIIEIVIRNTASSG